MRVLHCSDVHITADYFSLPFFKLGWRRWFGMLELTFGGRGRQYRAAPEVLARIVQQFESEKADHLVLSGDLTAYALEQEFEKAREVLGPLAADPAKCTIIPGNHDVCVPRSFSERLFEKYFGHLLVSDLPEYQVEGSFPFVRLVGAGLAVVGLGSSRVPPFPGFSYGWVGQAQLASLRKLLLDSRLSGRAVLAVVHHAPLLSDGRQDKPLHRLKDGPALLEALAGERHAILHGHVHQRFSHRANTSRPHVFNAGSSTQKGKEGYWLIDVDAGKIAGAEMRALR